MKNLKHLIISVLLTVSVISYAQEIGKPAPDFTYDILEGGKFTLSDQLGKVVVIFSFGYDCPFCVTSGPYVQSALVEHYANNSEVTLIGLDLWNGAPGSVSTFRSNTGLTMPLLLKASSFGNTYSITYDRLLVVDKNGVLTYRSNTDAGSNVDNAVAAVDAALAAPVAIKSVDAGEFNYTTYPNPAKDYLNMSFTLPKAGEANIRIIGLDGRILIDQGSSHFSRGVVNKISLDISSLSKGVYLSVLEHGAIQTIQKFVVN